ncbi:MAG: flagellar hook-associated protein FlgK [Lachnospirales bacterium]
MINSSFFEYRIATSALFTAQANMQISSHNMANAATPGYSRQYGTTTTYTPLSGLGSGMYGTGSYVASVNQHRSFFLDQKYWSHQSTLGEYSTKTQQNVFLQDILTTMDTDGGVTSPINSSVDDMFSALQDLSTNSGDITYRNNMLSSAESLTEIINSIGKKLENAQSDANDEIAVIVGAINSIGSQITSLNEQIRNYELNGDNANDLRDKRALLVDKLSEYVNVEVSETKRRGSGNENDTVFKIQINGYDFVSDTDLNALEVQERHVAVVDRINEIAGLIASGKPYSEYEDELKTYGNFELDGSGKLKFLGDPSTTDDDVVLDKNNKLISNPIPYLNKESYQKNPNDIEGIYDVYFTNPKQKFPMDSDYLEGSLKGLIDIRDGNNSRDISLNYGEVGQNLFGEDYSETSEYKGIPHYMEKLNTLVRTLAMSFNEGIDYSGNPLKESTGHVYGYNEDGKNGAFLFTYVDDTGKTVNTTDPTNPEYELANGNKTHLDYSKLNYKNFSVNSDLLEDPSNLALSSSPTADESDNSVVLSMLGIKTDDGLFAEGGLTDYITTITTEVGVDGKSAENFTADYTDSVAMVTNQRLSVSGVDLNEETATFLQYQQMYQAAAKIINIIDEIYNTCINNLGNF